MMFISLIPKLLSEFKCIGIYISNRLKSIYERSFAEEIKNARLRIFTKHDLADGSLKVEDFDFQLPLGSVCQHRFLELESYAPKVPILASDSSMSSRLRQDYFNISGSPDLLVGISWMGGGRASE